MLAYVSVVLVSGGVFLLLAVSRTQGQQNNGTEPSFRRPPVELGCAFSPLWR